MLGQEIELNLSVPEQTMSSLSFAETTPAGLKQWVEDLPMANIGETSRLLYQAIIEMNQLIVAPALRFQLLEIVRQPIRYACQELSKHFLNQAIVLPKKQQKIANLAQALQIHMATGYKVVMSESMPQMSHEKTRKNFACAAHRMMSEYGQVLLRANQLYSVAPKNIWYEMHRVFQFTESIDLLKYTIKDTLNAHQEETLIDQAYKRNLLLSCCRPNQLRQTDIVAAYDAFEVWSDYVEVGSDYSASAVFVINMEQDLPPRYRSLLYDTLSDHFYGFDTAELVSRITSHIGTLSHAKDDGVVHLVLPNTMSESLLNHVNQALGILTKRTFKRVANNGSLNVCAGLSASHFYTSGEVEFHVQMLHRDSSQTHSDDNIFMTSARRQNDAWSDAFDAHTPSTIQTTPGNAPITFNRPVNTDGTSYPQYQVPLINTSPGGYCLQWAGEIPSNIQAGEVLAIRESEKQPWSIAVIRWIRHARQKGTQIGIELLAPSAKPCGVQLLQRTGAPSEYLRGMLLPELTGIGQPATLITPRLPFQSGHKVSIRFNDNDTKCQLEKRIAATASFSQFELSQTIDQINTPSATGNHSKDSEDDFDSLWPTL